MRGRLGGLDSWGVGELVIHFCIGVLIMELIDWLIYPFLSAVIQTILLMSAVGIHRWDLSLATLLANFSANIMIRDRKKT